CDAGGATRRNPCLRYRSVPSARRRTGACSAATAKFFSWGRPWRRYPKARIVRDCRAYRRSMPRALGGAAPSLRGADAGAEPGKVLGPALIDARKPAHQWARGGGAAPGRSGQDGSQFCRLLGVEIAGGFAESVTRPGLDAELAIRPPLGDVEVDFQHAAFRQHQVEPHRQRDFQHLADDAAALPEEQILDGLLGDGRSAALPAGVVILFQSLAHGAEIDAAVVAKAAVLGADDGEGERR